MAACWALNCLGDVRESFKGAIPRLDLPPPSKLLDANANQDHVLFYGDQHYIDSRTTIVDMVRRWSVADPLGTEHCAAARRRAYSTRARRGRRPRSTARHPSNSVSSEAAETGEISGAATGEGTF